MGGASDDVERRGHLRTSGGWRKKDKTEMDLMERQELTTNASHVW